jgi:uncharacterized membrane protein YraQ (UPF0718 family)
MIIVLAVVFRIFLRQKLIDDARKQADQGELGSMEGHAAMDMSIHKNGSFMQRLSSGDGITSVSHIFIMEWSAVIKDVVGGLLIAGAVAAWVPNSFWQKFFFVGHPLLSKIWGPLVGPLVSVVSFVCSIGNVPLAAVLWNGGISFGGVVSFIFADLIILPILLIYKKYYGVKMMIFILGSFYVAMVIAGYLVEIIFGALGLIPTARTAKVVEASIQWNYTTVLNLIFLAIAGFLIYRFIKTGGRSMLKAMNKVPEPAHAHHHPA